MWPQPPPQPYILGKFKTSQTSLPVSHSFLIPKVVRGLCLLLDCRAAIPASLLSPNSVDQPHSPCHFFEAVPQMQQNSLTSRLSTLTLLHLCLHLRGHNPSDHPTSSAPLNCSSSLFSGGTAQGTDTPIPSPSQIHIALSTQLPAMLVCPVPGPALPQKAPEVP